MSAKDRLAVVPGPPSVTVQDAQLVSDLAFQELPDTLWKLTSAVSHFPLEFRDLYYSLVESLRRDARHLSVGTIAAMQLERVAFYYVSIRYGESHGGWLPRDREALYRRYREASNDFLAHSLAKKIDPADLHLMVSQHTAKIVANVLRTMSSEEAKPLYRKFAMALDESFPRTQIG